MILVMLGTNPYPFPRLLTAVDQWARSTGERVIAQTGHTPVEEVSVECHGFVSHEQILEWLAEADLAIVQGGLGSIMDCLKAGKATIVVPRKPEYGESQDVQSEVVDALASEGRILALHDMGDLADAIAQARSSRIPVTSESLIPDLVADYVSRTMR